MADRGQGGEIVCDGREGRVGVVEVEVFYFGREGVLEEGLDDGVVGWDVIED